MTDKFCRDCKHSRGDGVKMTCDSPHNAVPHVSQEKYLVTGIPQPTIMATRGATCTALRMKREPAIEALTCGPSGNWYEPKESAL